MNKISSPIRYYGRCYGRDSGLRHSNTLADMRVKFSALVSASAPKTPTLAGLYFFIFYFPSLFTFMVFKVETFT